MKIFKRNLHLELCISSYPFDYIYVTNKGSLFKKMISQTRQSKRVKSRHASHAKSESLFFHINERNTHAYTQHSGCVRCRRVSAHINIYPRVPRSACSRSSWLWYTRAWYIFFFSLLSGINFATGLQRRKKSFFVVLRPVPHKFVFTP